MTSPYIERAVRACLLPISVIYYDDIDRLSIDSYEFFGAYENIMCATAFYVSQRNGLLNEQQVK